MKLSFNTGRRTGFYNRLWRLHRKAVYIMNFSFEHVTPESVGVPSTVITQLLENLRRAGTEVHSFMLLRYGKVYAQGWYRPYAPEIPHIMFSFSKSFTSTAIGFARQEGILSLDEKLVDLFPELLPENPCENLKACTIAHLLMMGCGHEKEIDSLGSDPDWVKLFLHQPFPHVPGTHFLYNTAGTNMLSAILQKKTGQTLTEFLQPRLFAPLGIQDAKCTVMENGVEAGGFGYKLKTEDMARFIEFVRCKGNWQGQQLLDCDWFDLATSTQISNSSGGSPDWQSGYGFQFWRCSQPGVFRGDGAFGQYGIVIPEQEAVLVMTSCEMNMQNTLDVIWNTLLPAFENAPLQADAKAQSILSFRLSQLALDEVLSEDTSDLQTQLEKQAFFPKETLPCFTTLIGGAGRLLSDTGTLTTLSFAFDPEAGASLLVRETHRSYALPLGTRGRFITTEISGEPFAANGRWRAHNKLEAEIRNLKTCTGTRFLFCFEEDGMTVTADRTLPAIGGLADPILPVMQFEKGQ